MTCLSIVQTVCKRMGFVTPNTATGSTDPQIIQMTAILNEEGQELSRRHTWQALTKEATFTTVATEIQVAIPTAMRFIVNDTIWNRDLRRPVFGPLTAQRWQQLKASNIQGPWNQFRIQGGNIKFIPAPAAGETCAYEYVSDAWCYDTGGTDQTAFTNDDDVSYLDEQILQLGLRWRFKKEKGLEYGEDFATYERMVNDAIARDGGRDVLNLDGARWDVPPGVLVPSGNWNL